MEADRDRAIQGAHQLLLLDCLTLLHQLAPEAANARLLAVRRQFQAMRLAKDPLLDTPTKLLAAETRLQALEQAFGREGPTP